MRVSETIRQKLIAALSPEQVEVTDESHLHAGHAGAREGGESHFRLLVVASIFEGMNRVSRQRMVNEVLRDELAGPVHALAMKTLTPQEAAA
ncbi:MAG: BolA family transcriptional regulator [Parvularcula sp.]|nr:BolA family transcriptional regulator [Parvularcula sp.]